MLEFILPILFLLFVVVAFWRVWFNLVGWCHKWIMRFFE